jgi:hypothetical protein
MCVFLAAEPFNEPLINTGEQNEADGGGNAGTQDQDMSKSLGEQGSASLAGSQSEEDTTDEEEDDDDDDGEIKDDFTYQSDASYSQGIWVQYIAEL